MDGARRFIASETDRNEDTIKKADTALVGLAAQVLENNVDSVALITTDKPAGAAAETVLSNHGFGDRIGVRHASLSYIDELSTESFQL
jgi:hypothetical protein